MAFPEARDDGVALPEGAGWSAMPASPGTADPPALSMSGSPLAAGRPPGEPEMLNWINA
jgi:hypothetical protein